MSKSLAGAARKAKTEDAKLRKQFQNGPKTLDSFQNFAANLGLGTDNVSSGATYGFNPITRIRTLLEWIHRGSWLGGVVVDAVADDMTRAGVDLKGEIAPDDIQKLEEAAVTLQIWNAICDNTKWARLYGGSLAVMLIDGQDMSTPLRIETVGKGSFRGLYVMDRWQVQPTLNRPVTEFGPSLGKPKFYDVVSSGLPLSGKRIHHTRCIRQDGIKLPLWQAMTENMWSISVYERMYDRMVAFDSATTGAAQLVYKSYLRTYKVKDLRENVAMGGDAFNGLIRYVDMMRRFQSMEGITLLDAEDEFEGHSHNAFGGLSDALEHFSEQIAGCAGMPLVRLFGQSPKGMNATGESDFRMYYDNINKDQNATLKIPITTVYRLMAQSMGIALAPGFGIKFRPLWQLTDKEKSEVSNNVTTSVTQAFEAGLVTQKTAMKELKQSSEVTGVFTNITDEEIEAAQEELPPTPEEMAELEAENVGPQGEEGNSETEPALKTQDDAMERFVVVKHSSGDGYVVRTGYIRSDDTIWIPEPYARAQQLKIFKQRNAAEKFADKMNGLNTQDAKGPRMVSCPLCKGTGEVFSQVSSTGKKTCPICQGKGKVPTQDSTFRSVFGVAYHHDIPVAVENPKGTFRRGKNWEVTMAADYGYVRGVTGADGDQLDCFLGPNPESNSVYVINQRKVHSPKFDEHKIGLGFTNADQFTKAFAESYDDKGLDRIISIHELTVPEFKSWMKSGDLKVPFEKN